MKKALFSASFQCILFIFCLTAEAYSVSVKALIMCDLGMVAFQNHLVETVSLRGGGNLERSKYSFLSSYLRQ